MMTAYLCQPEVWIPPCWSGTDWLFQKLMNQVRTLKVVEAKMWEQKFCLFFLHVILVSGSDISEFSFLSA